MYLRLFYQTIKNIKVLIKKKELKKQQENLNYYKENPQDDI